MTKWYILYKTNYQGISFSKNLVEVNFLSTNAVFYNNWRIWSNKNGVSKFTCIVRWFWALGKIKWYTKCSFELIEYHTCEGSIILVKRILNWTMYKLFRKSVCSNIGAEMMICWLAPERKVMLSSIWPAVRALRSARQAHSAEPDHRHYFTNRPTPSRACF